MAIAYACSKITVNSAQHGSIGSNYVFVSTNGVHSDLILPIDLLSSKVLRNLYYLKNEKYLALGWGDRNFYINTPDWADLTAKNAFRAMFWKSPTLMHVTRYSELRSNWKKVPVSPQQLDALIHLAFADFEESTNGQFKMLNGTSYGTNDNFYEARGSYHCFKTCNTWINSILKKSGLPAALWTPFDFGVMDKY